MTSARSSDAFVSSRRRKNDLVTIDAKGVKDTFKIKLSTPASGILPLSAEKELSFDLAKYSYEEIRETLRDALGEGGRKVAQLFKVLKVLKKR